MPCAFTAFLVGLPRPVRDLVMVLADALVLPVALWSAVALRQGRWHLDPAPPGWAYAMAVAVTLAVFTALGLYRAVIRHFEIRALLSVIGAAALSALLLIAVVLLVARHAVPVSSLVIYGLLSAVYAALTRLVAREVLRGRAGQRDVVPIAIYGAGGAGRQLVQGLRQGFEYRPMMFIDDDPALRGRTVLGLKVHAAADLPALMSRHEFGMVVVAIRTLTPGQRATLLQRLGTLNTPVRMLAGVADMVRGKVGASELQEVRPEDLLGRDAVALDSTALTSLLGGQCVMVTGAGGSIGSELCRQVARYKPRLLVLFDISEYALYALREEFVALWPEQRILNVVGDVKNALRIRQVMEDTRPAIVFHAAAYKHVPLMEQINAWEAVRNNAWGTYVVGREAIRANVRKFVLVSTDKAVNPTNVMGATKRLAELTCQALHAEGRTQFEMVRFGNVLGSSGSVIPKFREQIMQGGPITVTHPDIVRYFMSIPEAAQLVLQAASMGQGGEVFVLDMGEPVRIVDLAINMIRLFGLSESEIPIRFTGLRPGEKLYEELLADAESSRPTPHPKIRVAKVQEASRGWCEELCRWVDSDVWFDDETVRRHLAKVIPEYRPWAEAVGTAKAAELVKT